MLDLIINVKLKKKKKNALSTFINTNTHYYDRSVDLTDKTDLTLTYRFNWTDLKTRMCFKI